MLRHHPSLHRLFVLTRPRRPRRRCSSTSSSSSQHGQHRSSATALLWEQRREAQKQAGGEDPSLPPQTELLSLETDASRVTLDYAFSTDGALRDRYTNSWGGMRKGVLFEDLDSLAGNVAFLHSDDDDPETRAPLLVTAAVDTIDFNADMPTDEDLVLEGRCVHVGSSSMRVRCEVKRNDQRGQDDDDGIALVAADFLYVARDQATGGPHRVNRLVPTSATDRDLFARFEAEAAARKQARKDTKAQEERQAREQREALALVSESQAKIRMPCLPLSEAVLVNETTMQNTLLCQPQQRNTSNRIFGGFLMRRAYELALTTSYCFAGQRPVLTRSADIMFNSAVSIGDILRLDSRVILVSGGLRCETEEGKGAAAPAKSASGDGNNHKRHVWTPDRFGQYVHVDVQASILRPEDAESVVSNTFAFAFGLDASGPKVRTVRPTRYGEALRQMQILSVYEPQGDRGGER